MSTTTAVRRSPSLPKPLRKDDPLRSIVEASAQFNVKERWFRRAIDEGRIEYVKVGAHVRIRQSVLDAYLSENTHRAR